MSLCLTNVVTTSGASCVDKDSTRTDKIEEWAAKQCENGFGYFLCFVRLLGKQWGTRVAVGLETG